jgi:hypothetical protein
MSKILFSNLIGTKKYQINYGSCNGIRSFAKYIVQGTISIFELDYLTHKNYIKNVSHVKHHTDLKFHTSNKSLGKDIY